MAWNDAKFMPWMIKVQKRPWNFSFQAVFVPPFQWWSQLELDNHMITCHHMISCPVILQDVRHGKDRIGVDCKTVGFFLKISKEIDKAWRKSLTRAKPHRPVWRVRREKKNLLSPVSLSVFSLVPDLLFDCSRLLEYAKIRTVLQSRIAV